MSSNVICRVLTDHDLMELTCCGNARPATRRSRLPSASACQPTEEKVSAAQERPRDVNNSLVRLRRDVKSEMPVREVRERASEILAAVGTAKLRRIALFRATKWANASTYTDDLHSAGLYWIYAAEWLRIGWAL
jgi:hypothetical protein